MRERSKNQQCKKTIFDDMSHLVKQEKPDLGSIQIRYGGDCNYSAGVDQGRQVVKQKSFSLTVCLWCSRNHTSSVRKSTVVVKEKMPPVSGRVVEITTPAFGGLAMTDTI
jgi:hypothetical protein